MAYDGIVTLEVAMSLMKSVSEHSDFTPRINRLWDFRQAKFDWDMADIERLVQYIESLAA